MTLTQYHVTVRELCAFAAQRGDLDLRFAAAPTALEGMAGHSLVSGRRSSDYERELALSGSYACLNVRGRADGYDPHENRLEEIKTYRGDLARIPASRKQLHWAQAKIYGWLLCEARQLEHLHIALVYLNITTQKETVLVEEWQASQLHQHFLKCCEAFLEWANRELAHRTQRDQWLQDLPFPFPAFRPGQREFSKAVFLASREHRCVSLQAPTGIGKSIGSLFPLLKAMPEHGLDKIAFLSARTTGRRVALDALQRLCNGNPTRLRVVELVAREKACEYPGQACTGDACPRAKGFFDRLPAARAEAAQTAWLDAAQLKAIAERHSICPYYLGQEMTRWSDVIVGDYNYYFDHGAVVFGLSQENQWQLGVLVDEAHNLVERARAMYSATLHEHQLKQLQRAYPALKASWRRLSRTWRSLYRNQETTYRAYDAIPEAWLTALRAIAADLIAYFEEQAADLHADLQQFYFDLLCFMRLAENFGEHSVFDITLSSPATADLFGIDTAGGPKRRTSSLCIRNVVPAPYIAARFKSARAVALFSATLGPHHYQSHLLGLPADIARLDIASPFSSDQLDVRIATHVSTRWADRRASLSAITSVIAEQFRHRRGLYLAYFSSYAYLQEAADMLSAVAPEIPSWRQERKMSESDRQLFLDRFTPGNAGVGFAVLGGAFGEGIDLPGERLVGVFIATLGLPQVNPINETIRHRMQKLFGNGYEYGYLFPGMQKVIQAAGRVIRTTSDTGVVILMDDRYAQPRVTRLLPPWWQITRVAHGDEVRDKSITAA